MEAELTIHKYYEEEDITEYPVLNPDLVQFVADRGWNIIEKIGEGSTADVFSCRLNNITAAIIFFSNVSEQAEAFDIDDEIDWARQFPKIFPIVYDIFKTEIPYSTDEHYLQTSAPFGPRTIQVIEKVDSNLAVYYAKLGPREKPAVRSTVGNVILGYLNTLREYEICYPDLKADNIGVIMVDGKPAFKLLDIEGIWLTITSDICNPPAQISQLLRELDSLV